MAKQIRTKMWDEAIAKSADPVRARHFHDLVSAAAGQAFLQKLDPRLVPILAALFSGSQTLSEVIVAHPDWVEHTLDPDHLANRRQIEGLEREVNDWLRPAFETRDFATAFSKLREFKQREMLRIGARDLSRLSHVTEITLEISNVADICLQTALRLCREQLSARLGAPYHQDVGGPWKPTGFAVFGMGKLGGQELNYSSDIDLLFAYSAEGFTFKTKPRGTEMTGRGQPNNLYFRHLAESLIAECTRMTTQGMLFRVDMRLRPEGKGGPLARSLSSYENYYAQYGQTWERMMLIKARCVAGDGSLGAEFLEMIQPFRYPRSLGEEISREVAAMKERIENEVVKAGEMDRNVKLGRGGIREIEFIAQTHQVLYGGRMPFLQGHQTLPTLQNLHRYQLLPADEVKGLTAAYVFLRDVEHRLQMDNNRQTHTIPTDRKSRDRLAALMNFDNLREFESALSAHTEFVRGVYDRIFKTAAGKPLHDLPTEIREHEERWKEILRDNSFRDLDQAYRMAREFVLGPGFGHVSARTSETALLLLSKLFQVCRKQNERPSGLFLSDPDRVLSRVDSFVAAYGARATLYEAWRANLSLFNLLLFVFDRSEFLAEAAIRTPDLIDTLEQSGQLRRQKNRELIANELSLGIADEDQHLWMRRYHEAEMMRIGLRNILALAGSEQTQAELTALSEACFEHAFNVVLRRNKLKTPPFAIVALGKLGGSELIYGSDCDVVFVAPEGAKNLPKLCQIAIELLDLLNKRTDKGVVLEADTRLRPDGEKGLLVNTLPAYREYYQKRALLWEIQSLTRARPIAGDAAVGNAFNKMADELTDFRHPKVQCHHHGWMNDIAKMRYRIEKERTPTGQEALAIKTGKGALIDGEFMAQALCLQTGKREPNTVKALLQAKEANLGVDGEKAAENYRKLVDVELILRRWSLEPESVLPKDPEPLYRVAVRCGFLNTDIFLAAVAKWRSDLRQAFLQVFPDFPG